MLKFTAARLLVPILGATALAGAAVASPSTSASEAASTAEPVASTAEAAPLTEANAAPAAQEQETTPILCGGYDADGELVDARAAETTEVPVNADGTYDVPDFCRGYTADGTFVGDD